MIRQSAQIPTGAINTFQPRLVTNTPHRWTGFTSLVGTAVGFFMLLQCVPVLAGIHEVTPNPVPSGGTLILTGSFPASPGSEPYNSPYASSMFYKVYIFKHVSFPKTPPYALPIIQGALLGVSVVSWGSTEIHVKVPDNVYGTVETYVGIFGYRYQLHQKRFYNVSMKPVTIVGGPPPPRADLYIQKFEFKSLNDKWYFLWHVRNIGEGSMPSAKLRIDCSADFGSFGMGPCPPTLSGQQRHIGALSPATAPEQVIQDPNYTGDPDSEWVVSLETTDPKEAFKFKFTAKVDPSNAVKEEKENNNVLVSYFDSKAYLQAKFGKFAVANKLGVKKSQVKSKPVFGAKVPGNAFAKTMLLTPQGGMNGPKHMLKARPLERTIQKPVLWFDLSGPTPAPHPKLNKAFNIVIGIKNTGKAKNGTSAFNKVTVKLGCQPVDGGACQILLSDPVAPVIQPGTTKPLYLTSVFKPTKAGKYHVSLVLSPAPTGFMRYRGLSKSWSMNFTIPKLQVKPSALKTIPVIKKTRNSSRAVITRASKEHKAVPKRVPRIRLVPTINN